jgi:hypothetical protein
VDTEQGAETGTTVEPSTSVQDIPWDAPSEPTAAAEPDTSEAAAPTTYKVKVGGEERDISLDEALKGYMRQEDYTRKTQEVAQQRETLSYADQLAQALETDPARALQVLSQAYSVDLSTLGQPQQEAAAEEPQTPEQQFQQRVEAFMQQSEQRAFEQQVTAELATLHSAHGEFDETALIQFAVDHNIPSLTDAMKVLTFDAVIGKATAEDKAAAAKQGLSPVAPGHGVAGGAVVPGAQNPRPSVQEAAEAAFKAHGASI